MSWIDPIRRGLGRVDVQVATRLGLLLAPLIGGIVFLFFAYAAHEALEEIDRGTWIRIVELSRAIDRAPGVDPADTLAPIGAALDLEGIGFTLLDAGGAVLARSGAPVDAARLLHYRGGFAQPVLVSERDFLHYSLDLPSGLRIEATVTLAHFAEERMELVHAAWICFASGLISAALVALLATRNALSPLRSSTAAIGRINASQLDARLPLRRTGDDVDRHAAAVNRVLERLEAAFVRMSAFSSDVAHELRTPVNRILNLAEVALLGEGEAQERKALESIRDAADDMSRLVEGLLMLARGEQGELALDLRRLSVAELVAELGQLYAPACEEQGIHLETVATDGSVRADRTLLSRALANLLDNAIRYTPRGGRVRVEVAPRDGEVSIDVCDSGAGIPASEREAVFERFTRLDRSRSGPGIGLGLSIARMIAGVHGGELRVSDSPLGGARFSLRLPADPGPGAQAERGPAV